MWYYKFLIYVDISKYLSGVCSGFTYEQSLCTYYFCKKYNCFSLVIGHSISDLASVVMQITGFGLSCSDLFFQIRKLDHDIKEMEAKIIQRYRGLSRKAISEFCGICFKVKVASTKALICKVCGKKTCTRCGKSKEVRRIIRHAIYLYVKNVYIGFVYQPSGPSGRCLSRFLQYVFLLTPGWYPLIHLGGEGHCDSKVSCPSLQCPMTAQSGDELTNHGTTAPPTKKFILDRYAEM